jgi:hypothetical protein
MLARRSIPENYLRPARLILGKIIERRAIR